MSAWARVYFSTCATLIGFALTYALPVYVRLPRAFYDPIARTWTIASTMGPIPMGYVGQIIWGVGGGFVCGVVAAATTYQMIRDPSERAFGLWGAWALTALGITLGYFTWNNWP